MALKAIIMGLGPLFHMILGFRVWGLGSSVKSLKFRVCGLGFGVRVWGLRFRV